MDDLYLCSNSLDRTYTQNLGIEFCAFGGAGVLGISYAGAIQALDEFQVRPHIKYYTGSSAGAISALLAACGANSSFCKNLLETDLSSFLDYAGNEESTNKFSKILSLTQGTAEMFVRLGQARGDSLTKWIGDCLEMLGFSRDLTFAELYNQTGNHCCITSTSLTTFETVYFSRASYPDMIIRHAIHSSIILPFIFQPIQIIDPMSPTGDRLLVDGGILDNYPLNVCDLLDLRGKLTAVNRKAIGFIPMSGGSWVSNYDNVNDLVKFSSNLLQNIHNRLHVLQSTQPYFWKRTISIETGEISSRDFSLTNEQKETLFKSGYHSAKRYLEKRKAMVVSNGDLPDNLFIPITYGASSEVNGIPECIPNEALENTLLYQTNPAHFSFKNFC